MYLISRLIGLCLCLSLWACQRKQEPQEAPKQPQEQTEPNQPTPNEPKQPNQPPKEEPNPPSTPPQEEPRDPQQPPTNNPKEPETPPTEKPQDPNTPPTTAPKDGDSSQEASPNKSEYSVEARRGQIWWVKGVNTNAPAVSSWREVTRHSGIKGLKWDKSYGWYDLNKTEPHSGGIDSDLCWAAVSANAIQWWLDQNKDYLTRYNYSGPKLFTDSYHSEVFDLYKRHFKNKGGDLKASMDWFFNGLYAHLPLPGAGFLRQAFGADFKAVEQIGAHASTFSEDIAKALKSGESISCDLKYPRGYLHALSVWGAEFDDKGEVSHLYLTDSNDKDDAEQKENAFVTQAGLLRRAIQLRDGSVWQADSGGKFTYQITRLYKLGLHQDKWENYFKGESHTR